MSAVATSMDDMLITVYANGTALDDSIHSTQAYLDMCERYGNNNVAFDKARAIVEVAKKELEIQMVDQTPASQVSLALKGARRRRLMPPEEQELYFHLVLASYERFWTSDQRSYFEKWCKFLFRSRDYFLSFTNRNVSKDEGLPNIVNTDHEFFIRSRIPTYESLDRVSQNLLAMALHYLLQQKNFTGFYYPEHDDFSYEVEEKLRTEVTQSMVFIQIVQGVMFSFAPSMCHLEFTNARDCDPVKPMIFLDAELSLLGDDRVTATLFNWYSYVSHQGRIRLGMTSEKLDNVIRHNHQVIEEKIVRMLDVAAQRIYEGVPDL